MIEVAATASVGETTAPMTNAVGHGRPGITVWATQATPSVVHTTRPNASSEIERRAARKSRADVNHADLKSSGGRNTRKTISGCSTTRGMPGTKPSASPPRTSTMGYGRCTRRAIMTRTTTATSRIRISSVAGIRAT